MRSRSKNRATRRKGNNGTNNRRETWLQRETNRKPPRTIAVRRQPLRRQRKRRKPPSHREHRRSPRPHRGNGYLPHKRTRKPLQGIGALLQNLHNHPRQRLNVPQMPSRNAPGMGGEMLLLPLRVSSRASPAIIIRFCRLSIPRAVVLYYLVDAEFLVCLGVNAD